MEDLKISVITPSYNSARTIDDTLKSVAMQKGVNVEHIIVDGLSTDNTALIVKNYPHISRFDSEKDKGIYDAMNKGIERAIGDIIGILNSDDVYTHPNVLANVSALFNDGGVDAVYADLEYVKPDDLSKVVRYWRSGEYKMNNFFFWLDASPSNLFCKKRIVRKIWCV